MHDRIFDIFRQRLEAFYTNELLNMYPESIPLKAEFGWSKDPVPFKDRLKLKYEPAYIGMIWGHEWESAWFHFTATVPKEFAGKELCVRINTGGEGCVFDESGCPIYGLTDVSVFDSLYFKDRYALGRLKAREKIDIWVESAANALFGINQPRPYDKNPAKTTGSYNAQIKVMELCVFDREMHGLLTDFRILSNLMDTFDKKDYRARQLLYHLNKALDIYNYDSANAAKSRKYLKDKVFCNHATDTALTACCIGHAHIDVGWLWPVRESIRKAGRTFSSQLMLMEKYPQYHFGASQAELYKMTKDNYPALYEKIKRRVAEGRWEVQGGMWVEADCNIISGESMVRQILHGKNFFMDEFGVDVRTIWIPDVFGYSAAMPQIMLKSGCDYFLTQKISWSQVNTFPHTSFRWKGVDGTEVLAHFPPENTYNSSCLPDQRKRGTENFQEAGITDEFMCLYGIGDGGGGPSEDYIERNERIKDLEGCPKAIYGNSIDFFKRLEKVRDELPVWNGELYLEFHRGTLTTQARTKRNNRKCEQALTKLEFLASCLPMSQYPAAKLDEAWKKLLVNHFHDIIPGSSIGLVYKTTEKQHAEILEMCREESARAAKKLFKANAEAAVVVNSLGIVWQGCVELPDDWKDCRILADSGSDFPTQIEDGKVVAYLTVPATSFCTLYKSKGKSVQVKARKKAGLVLENSMVRYTFNEKGQLVSAVDLERDREIMKEPGNVLSLYNDRPTTYEAWDIEMFYPRDFKGIMPCVEAGPVMTGPARSFIKFTYKTEKSTMVQTVILYPNSPRLDFVNHVEWHESRTMLRTAFPVNIQAPEASYDIQYAYVKRPTNDNTSWEQAKFEAVGQRYADLSQDDYGVALMNDCKYGYRVKGSTLDLNLLRSPKHPDFNADQGEHDFTYSFYPHKGDHVSGCVPEVSAMLNREPYIAIGFEAKTTEFPCRVDSKSVSLEVLKKAEKDDSRIIRLVETGGKHCSARLYVDSKVKRVSETNLLEWEHGCELPISFGIVHLEFKPFEIITLRLE
ncbi:MAG: alpha-mannosidase [Victivallales bacterium]|nr:alpha-mannosidase [Victivallales bacterium]